MSEKHIDVGYKYKFVLYPQITMYEHVLLWRNWHTKSKYFSLISRLPVRDTYARAAKLLTLVAGASYKNRWLVSRWLTLYLKRFDCCIWSTKKVALFNMTRMTDAINSTPWFKLDTVRIFQQVKSLIMFFNITRPLFCPTARNNNVNVRTCGGIGLLGCGCACAANDWCDTSARYAARRGLFM